MAAPWTLLLAFGFYLSQSSPLRAQKAAERVCPRPAEGATVQDPPVVASQRGTLDLVLNFHRAVAADGAVRFCYRTESGLESPTLRFSPGDRIAIHLHNGLPAAGSHSGTQPAPSAEADCHGSMSASATNLHFHGMTLPPVCHQDESIHTLVGPGESFLYDLRVPQSASPGLYWYHPHPHGLSTAQVQGGASGAILIDGIEAAVPAVRNLPERTFVLRDQPLPAAFADRADPAKPSWDVSVNYVPVRYPEYKPARIEVAAGERQFWRVVNAASSTMFHLQIVYDGVVQPLETVATDGTPLAEGITAKTAIFLAPGARAEFIVKTPAVGVAAQLITKKHDPGPAGDITPARPLADIVALAPSQPDAKPRSIVSAAPTPQPAGPTLSGLKPVRVRTLYFSQNGNGTEGGAGAADKFYLTVVGQPIQPFDMDAPPNIVAEQGTVEDWILFNRTPEDHIFHIHQVHFQIVAVDGVPVDDPVIRDTILVPHPPRKDDASSVTLRIDFRDPGIVGVFPYHCQILDHQDRGMMGKVQVVPPGEVRK